jgi:GxxExxY protein
MESNDQAGKGLTRRREEREEKSTDLNVEELSAVVVDAAFHLHCDLGPGLLESVYEAILARLLQDRGLSVVRQLPVPIEFAGLRLDEGFRADLVVDDLLIIELKSVEQLAPVHAKQLLTYLRLMHLPLGLLINFGAATFKEGVKRIANNHRNFAASRLRVNWVVAGPEGSREAAKIARDGIPGPHDFV